MSGQQQPLNQHLPPSTQNLGLGAGLAHQPGSFWAASLASLGVIIGGVGPWATYLNYVSISGTSMHGWREVAVGAIALVMLGLYHFRGWRTPLIVAGILGALGLIGAIEELHNITNGGAVTVFGVTYRYMTADWGLYLVLVGTLVLLLASLVLVLRAFGSSITRWRSRAHRSKVDHNAV
jgi:hypothetical protein